MKTTTRSTRAAHGNVVWEFTPGGSPALSRTKRVVVQGLGGGASVVAFLCLLLLTRCTDHTAKSAPLQMPDAAGGSSGSAGGSSFGGKTALGGSVGSGGALHGAGGNATAGNTNAGAATSGGGQSGTSSGGAPGAGGGDGGTPFVRVVGRTLVNGDATRFGWPGVAFHARFSGTQAAIQLSDGSNQNAFEVSIDGAAPKKFRTSAGETSYPLATGLTSGNHEVLVWRCSEVFDSGPTDFIAIGDFGNGGALLAPPPAVERRIEVIGDSISVGAGLEGGAASCAADKFSTDNYYAYGSVAARAVKADVVTIAYSGIGVYRSYGGATTMPQRYDGAVPDNPAPWDFAKYQPQVVVINLGTNDFDAGDPGQPFVDAYVNFVKHVRSKYAGAYFILIAMYGDLEAEVSDVATNLEKGGDSRVEVLKFDSVQNEQGCAEHPDAAAQLAMGAVLATRLKAVMGW